MNMKPYVSGIFFAFFIVESYGVKMSKCTKWLFHFNRTKNDSSFDKKGRKYVTHTL